jgi:hypothetical protein
MDTGIEARFVNAFVIPRMRDRWLLKLRDKSRHIHLQRLNHNFDFEPTTTTRLKKSSERQQELLDSLRAKGSPDQVHMISAREEFDAKPVKLSELLKQRWGIPSATVLICIPERLAIFCDDSDALYLLENGT